MATSRDSPTRVEFVDLTGNNRVCVSRNQRNSVHSTGPVGTFINDVLIVCRRNCSIFNNRNDRWRGKFGNFRRLHSFGIQLDSQNWWITGGNGGARTTEIYDTVSESFRDGGRLPQGRKRHNLVRVNETHIMLIGDQNANFPVYLYDQRDLSWTPVASPNQDLQRSTSGYVIFPNGTRVVITVGGDNTIGSKIYDIENNRWFDGPDVPDLPMGGGTAELKLARPAQLSDTFLIVGGEAFGQKLDSIYIYNVDTEMFELLPMRMAVARSELEAVLIPDTYVFCINVI